MNVWFDMRCYRKFIRTIHKSFFVLHHSPFIVLMFALTHSRFSSFSLGTCVDAHIKSNATMFITFVHTEKKKERIRKNEWKKRWKRKCPKMWHTQTTHSYGCRCANDSLNNERKTINDLWLHGHISTLYTCERFWQHLTCSMYNQLKNMYTRTYSPSERNVVWRWHRQQHKSDDVKMKGNDGKLKKKKNMRDSKYLRIFSASDVEKPRTSTVIYISISIAKTNDGQCQSSVLWFIVVFSYFFQFSSTTCSINTFDCGDKAREKQVYINCSTKTIRMGAERKGKLP